MNDLRYPIGRFAPPPAYSGELRTGFIDQIAALPAELRAAVHSLTPSQLQTPYREGGWTVTQVVHHLPDSHVNAYVRFRLAVTEDSPTIKPYVEGRWAELADATSPDIAASLALIEGLHTRWTVLLRSLRAEDFAKTFIHPQQGTVPLDRQLALYAWHGRHHVAHITALRERMGW
jgi:hypothetical protein